MGGFGETVKVTLDDGTVFRITIHSEFLLHLRDKWLKDGTRNRTFGGALNVTMYPHEEAKP